LVVRVENQASKLWEIVRTTEAFLAEEDGQGRSKWETCPELRRPVIPCFCKHKNNVSRTNVRGTRTNAGLRTDVRVPPFRRRSCRSRAVSVGREKHAVLPERVCNRRTGGAAEDQETRAWNFRRGGIT
jgi:hypothetical protein